MSILGRLSKRSIGLSPAQESWVSGDLFNGGSATSAGVNVNTDSALQLLSVYACVRIYSQVIGSMPLSSYIRDAGASKPLYPRPLWIDRPTMEDTQIEWVSRVISSLLLDGNCFLLILRDETGAIVELIPLNPGAVSVSRDGGTKVYRLGGSNRVFTDADILHMKYLTLPGALRGLNPISYARQTIGLGLALDDFGGKFFSNGAHLGGVIEFPKDMTPDAAAALKAGWGAEHQGLTRAHLPAVLSSGAQWKPLSVTNNDAQFLETRAYTAQTISAQLFGVPPWLIGSTDGSSNWGTGLEQQFQGWLSIALNPLLEIVEQALSVLLDGQGFVKFKTDSLLRSDSASRWATYRIQVEMGAASIDEVRRREDQAPLPDGSGAQYFRPANWVPLDYVPAPGTVNLPTGNPGAADSGTGTDTTKTGAGA